ncbi:uncharacterized protein EI97DRAFT_458466 [Westerdykella ornata]|uniref:Uncharacterized protein n=1 Tax=Westerdykella ornata TaxID=318751 RepID=A0A6A6JIS1_WESOR|nr:uncharacterized protein EI97DRAFT_458466 [Westerdykella ornata]KAF2276550.1 hypothetical protein EI97DRAFT_458466 [Westerdykella ornata]
MARLDNQCMRQWLLDLCARHSVCITDEPANRVQWPWSSAATAPSHSINPFDPPLQTLLFYFAVCAPVLLFLHSVYTSMQRCNIVEKPLRRPSAHQEEVRRIPWKKSIYRRSKVRRPERDLQTDNRMEYDDVR